MGLAVLAVVSACSSDAPPDAPSLVETPSEPERVPNPPPRHAHAALDAGISLPPEEGASDAGEPQLKVECGRNEPYVCTLDDGTYRCSDKPCLPSCDRVGCLEGEVCVDCGGTFRCLGAKDAFCGP